tara:strand:+ start:636 stop:803 length:168 start_codon:yes stop_codon:yes gene_type:complete
MELAWALNANIKQPVLIRMVGRIEMFGRLWPSAYPVSIGMRIHNKGVVYEGADIG